ncbi:hypothetical protein Q0Z83_089530 [Actinoplanes sichuanensis]|nr:hypothetical protein Q0Z83_089530 [Actinoplanes sichuanensis]
MGQDTESEELAAALFARLTAVPRAGLVVPEITALLTQHVVDWASELGWQPEREVRGRLSRHNRSGVRQGRLDVVCQRLGPLPPVVIEIDRSGKVWSLRKLLAEVDAGAVALWVRWRGRTQVAIPADIGLVDISGTAPAVRSPHGTRI